MKIMCPTCGEEGLVVYPHIPFPLYPNTYHKMCNPIITEKTDVLCLDCYWQGEVRELKGTITTATLVTEVTKRVSVRLGLVEEDS